MKFVHNAATQNPVFRLVVYVKQKTLRDKLHKPARTRHDGSCPNCAYLLTDDHQKRFCAILRPFVERGEIPWFSKPAARPLNDISALSSASDSQFNNVSVSSSASDHSRPTTAKGMTMIWQTAQKRYKPARMHHNRSCHTVSVPSSASDQPRSMTGKRVITIW